MPKVEYFKHNQLKDMIAESAKCEPAVEGPIPMIGTLDMTDIEPIIASNDGYILTKDERILCRMGLGSAPVNLWRSETKNLGLDHPGIGPKEAKMWISRMAQLPMIEAAAINAQRDAARLSMALTDLVRVLQQGQDHSKALVKAATVLRDME